MNTFTKTLFLSYVLSLIISPQSTTPSQVISITFLRMFNYHKFPLYVNATCLLRHYFSYIFYDSKFFHTNPGHLHHVLTWDWMFPFFLNLCPVTFSYCDYKCFLLRSNIFDTEHIDITHRVHAYTHFTTRITGFWRSHSAEWSKCCQGFWVHVKTSSVDFIHFSF